MSDFAYPLHEECGVFGIYDRAGTEDVAAAAYSALYALQHRGQESCGIAVNDDGVIQGHRDLGLVNEVFTPAVLGSLSTPTAHMATGHVRYATAGSRVRWAERMCASKGMSSAFSWAQAPFTTGQSLSEPMITATFRIISEPLFLRLQNKKKLWYTCTTAFISAYALPALCTKLHDAPEQHEWCSVL